MNSNPIVKPLVASIGFFKTQIFKEYTYDKKNYAHLLHFDTRTKNRFFFFRLNLKQF